MTQQQLDIKTMQELIKLKKEKPDEYQEFLGGMEEVMKDIMNITTKLAIKLAKDMEAKFP